jgi:S1-C subfamily serine protease
MKSNIKLPPLLMLIAIAVLTGTQDWSAAVGSKNAQPRPVAARGQLMADELIAVKAFSSVSPSVVFITSRQTSRDLFHLHATEVKEDAGSGFVWDPNGYIVTNYHVVGNSQSVRIALSDQSIYKAQRVGADPDKDIAVLKIDAPPRLLPAIPIGTSRDLQVGQRVYALGNPFGYDQTMTSGIVSGLGREITSKGGRSIKGVIQTDAPLNPGNSGGPLLDSAGRIIGMNTAILSPTGANAGIGFAIPIDCINRIVPQIIRGETTPRPQLRVTTAEDHLVRGLGLEGVLLLNVAPDTTAEKAGLRGTRRNEQGKIVLGDVITAMDSQPIHTTDDFYRLLEEHKIGDTVRLTILREGQKMDVQVVLEPPA